MILLKEGLTRYVDLGTTDEGRRCIFFDLREARLRKKLIGTSCQDWNKLRKFFRFESVTQKTMEVRNGDY